MSPHQTLQELKVHALFHAGDCQDQQVCGLFQELRVVFSLQASSSRELDEFPRSRTWPHTKAAGVRATPVWPIALRHRSQILH